MLETSQSLIRAIALAALTAIFAGMWNNDRPTDPTLAMRLPADQRSFVVRHVSTSPVFKQAASQTTVARTRPPVSRKSVRVADTSTVSQQNPLAQYSRTVSVETDGLMIPQGELSRHLNQLPLGIVAGDYRIVDSQGGVGWLHVVEGSQVSLVSTEAEMLTTEVGHSIVRFIPVRQGRTASLRDVISH